MAEHPQQRREGLPASVMWAKESEVRTQRQLLQGGKVRLPSSNTTFCSLFPSSPKQGLQESPTESPPGLL